MLDIVERSVRHEDGDIVGTAIVEHFLEYLSVSFAGERRGPAQSNRGREIPRRQSLSSRDRIVRFEENWPEINSSSAIEGLGKGVLKNAAPAGIRTRLKRG